MARYRKVKPGADELAKKIARGERVLTFRERLGAASQTDIELERLGALKAQAITSNEEYREARPGQIEVPRDQMVAAVRAIVESGHDPLRAASAREWAMVRHHGPAVAPLIAQAVAELTGQGRSLQQQYLPRIQEQARTLDLGKVMAMVGGTQGRSILGP